MKLLVIHFDWFVYHDAVYYQFYDFQHFLFQFQYPIKFQDVIQLLIEMISLHHYHQEPLKKKKINKTILF
jgi:hypothetical protein